MTLSEFTMEHNGMKVFLSKETMLYRIRNNQFIRGTCPPLILYTKKNLLYIKSRDICYYWSMTFFSHVQIHPNSGGGSLFFKKFQNYKYIEYFVNSHTLYALYVRFCSIRRTFWQHFEHSKRCLSDPFKWVFYQIASS